MKKLIILILAIATSVTICMNADTITNKITLKCKVCEQGHLEKSTQGVIFEFSEKGLEPKFDAVFLKCDHCQSLMPTKNYNAYFSIPAPK